MILKTIGPRGWHAGAAVATLAFTPLYDRAAIVKRVLITNPSAKDTWVFSTQGQEVARFVVDTVGNNYLLGGTSTQFPQSRDIFEWLCAELGLEMSYPVAQGQTFTVSSVGGATANVSIEFEEHSTMDVSPGMVNGQSASRYIMPVFLVPSATVTHASGTNEDNFASQVAALWLPSLIGLVQIPAAYKISILAYFLQGAGVNTYSGSADHLSTTDHLGLIYQGQRFYTRDSNAGIPVVGGAAAAGSANTVYTSVHNPYPEFQRQIEAGYYLPDPLVLMPGSQAQFVFGSAGDSTGGANYSHATQVLIADVQFTGMMAQ
jgi:hypothetical protein